MRWFKRTIPDPSEETPESAPAEPENPEPKPETPPDPHAAAKSDLALAMAQYGARHYVFDEEEAEVVSEASPMVRLANTILQQAIKDGASQILVEPDRRGLRTRYRVDGLLHEVHTMPSYIKAPLIARYLYLAEMSLLPPNAPQSGRIAISYESIPYDLRVRSTPTEHGLLLSMRILDKRQAFTGLKTLGISNEVHVQIDDLVEAPSGIFLATGPVGCGKSVTLYNLLNRLNEVERHCAVIESEAEYRFNGPTMVRTGGKHGPTYEEAFRSLVLAQAEVILAERLPDAEAWNAALTASEEGTLVLASMTVRDAPTALWHLRNMGLDSERISRNITGVLAQRLVRKICKNCKEFYEADAAELAPLGLRLKDKTEKVQLARGAGCDQCRKTGYKGQTGIFSLMRFDQIIRSKIVRGDFSPDLYESALANGMHLLREDGLEKILLGLTTVHEVYAAIGH